MTLRRPWWFLTFLEQSKHWLTKALRGPEPCEKRMRLAMVNWRPSCIMMRWHVAMYWLYWNEKSWRLFTLASKNSISTCMLNKHGCQVWFSKRNFQTSYEVVWVRQWKSSSKKFTRTKGSVSSLRMKHWTSNWKVEATCSAIMMLKEQHSWARDQQRWNHAYFAPIYAKKTLCETQPPSLPLTAPIGLNSSQSKTNIGSMQWNGWMLAQRKRNNTRWNKPLALTKTYMAWCGMRKLDGLWVQHWRSMTLSIATLRTVWLAVNSMPTWPVVNKRAGAERNTWMWPSKTSGSTKDTPHKGAKARSAASSTRRCSMVISIRARRTTPEHWCICWPTTQCIYGMHWKTLLWYVTLFWPWKNAAQKWVWQTVDHLHCVKKKRCGHGETHSWDIKTFVFEHTAQT